MLILKLKTMNLEIKTQKFNDISPGAATSHQTQESKTLSNFTLLYLQRHKFINTENTISNSLS